MTAYYQLLSNCISYCTESARNEYKHPTILYGWLSYSAVHARAYPVTLEVFFQVTEKG